MLLYRMMLFLLFTIAFRQPMKPNNYQCMRKIFFVFFIFFTVSSCTQDDTSFNKKSKKELMESWAWKIFIFTDEGEALPRQSALSNFNDITNGKTIFVEDIWNMNLKDDLFLKHHEVALEDETDYGNIEIAKKK